MGSSKKHKEKDRGGVEDERRRGERGERRPRGHRSRSRSRDRDRDRERDRTRSRRERRDRGDRGERGEDTSTGGPPPEKRSKRDHEGDEAVTEGGDVPAPKSASGNNSLSIEETNKLRAKLGLKPLETSDAAKQSEEGSSKDNPVLFHPENLASIKKKAVLKEKLAALKEKRLINQKLGKVRTLAEEEDWLDDAAVWVQRSRKLQQEKDMAQKRAKVLEEMDAEFGISSLVEEEMGAKKEPSYTSKDLTGLSVEHDIETFQEGQTVILTLKDKAILDEEDGDVLVNVNMVDKEKADKNVELKKKKPVYQPYAEDESVDDLAIMRQRAVLSKYDEEIDGEKRKSFQLEHGGTADGSWERELQSVRDTLRSQAQRLETAVPQIANEFYSPQEMVMFRKTKRRVKKIRRREKTLRADQLAPLPGKTSGGAAASDLGSRRRPGTLPLHSAEGEGEQAEGEEVRGDGRGGGEERQEEEEGHDADTTVQDMQMSDDEEELVTPASPVVVVEEDEAEQELQRQLDKQRRLRQKRDLRDAAIRVATVVRSMQSGERRGENDGGEDEEEEDEERMVLGERDRHGHIVFNSTSEFCRTLGEIPTYGLSGNRDDRDDLLDFEQSDSEMRADEEDEEGAGWSAVNLEEERERVETPTGAGAILEEEPMITGGLASALKLCNTKGYLETEVSKMARVKNPHKTLPSALYTIEDKNHGSDDKYSRREEYRAYGQEFKDKEHYRPDVRIEYVDETGRKLTPKEAFRQLSHRFHGKGSGRMKTEKRQKKLEEEHMLRKMSSSDTPLGTVALLQEKQKAQKTPFIILSGSGKSMNANTITK
ncbi:U4/U6.U5 tri-snRNP-associated protein 1 [Lethenteron reissneri]|uniref:U4/U6.U5 tri-snRNP-associated protein 1 n=1 Tax=Lethenteron reissneri TaxID=7753 RepID=UPI002AB7665E|nr:U4/U6.U5 tri-snRNP-associated protein 1 [Lethenteron reissneri]